MKKYENDGLDIIDNIDDERQRLKSGDSWATNITGKSANSTKKRLGQIF